MRHRVWQFSARSDDLRATPAHDRLVSGVGRPASTKQSMTREHPVSNESNEYFIPRRTAKDRQVQRRRETREWRREHVTL